LTLNRHAPVWYPFLSKKEGETWGINNVPEHYHALISAALNAYCFNEPINDR